MEITHLHETEVLALIDEIEKVVADATLAIGLRHQKAGLCFDCYLRAELTALSLVLAADIAVRTYNLEVAAREQYLAKMVDVIRGLTAAAVKHEQDKATAGSSVVH